MSTKDIFPKQKPRTAWKFDRGQWEEIYDSEMEHYLRKEGNFREALYAAGYELRDSILLGDEDGEFYVEVNHSHDRGKEPRYRYFVAVCTGGSYIIESIYVVDFPSLLILLNQPVNGIQKTH